MKNKRSLLAGTVALIVLGALALAGCGGEATTKAAPEKTAKVGQKVSLKGTAYKVTKVRKAPSVGDQYSKVKANGIFVIVNLTLTNEKKEPATIVEDLVRIKGGNGAEYSTSIDASMSISNSLSVLAEMQPGVAQKVVAIYDVPKTAVKGSQLLVKDFWSDSTATITLGL